MQLALKNMVAQQLAARDIHCPRLLHTMASIDRARFVPPHLAAHAYADHPLPIAAGQTISQPYVVAFMTQAMVLRPGHRVLEIGTGSGYQTAVLAHLGCHVYTIEIHPTLTALARTTLAALGLTQIHFRCGDGYLGWPEMAPFDAIIAAAVAPKIPPPLTHQLHPEGRLIMPIGDADEQHLVLAQHRGDRLQVQRLLPVRFVPMTGLAEASSPPDLVQGSSGAASVAKPNT